jgi:hypothetical protein
VHRHSDCGAHACDEVQLEPAPAKSIAVFPVEKMMQRCIISRSKNDTNYFYWKCRPCAFQYKLVLLSCDVRLFNRPTTLQRLIPKALNKI